MLSFVHINVSWTTRLTLKWLITVLKFLPRFSVKTMLNILASYWTAKKRKFHINNVALKISRTVGVVARLRHLVSRTTLLNIYQSLILPYLTYGLAASGPNCQNSFTKNSHASKTSPSFDLFFWNQNPCCAFIYFLKNSTLTNVICWKSIFYNVWCYFTISSVIMTAVTFPLRPPRLQS